MLFTLWARLSYFLGDFALYLILLSVSLALVVFGSYKVYKSDFTEKKKKIALAVIFVVFFLILVFSAFEAYFRYRYDQSDGLGFLKVNARWQARHVVFNSDFFRDRNFGDKKEGTKRICAIGDSVTLGGGIKNTSDRFTNLLEKELRAANYNAEVYNLGKSGYDTDGEKAIYESTKFLNCDIIIWAYFLNDVQPQGASTGSPIISAESRTTKLVAFVSNHSYFFDYLYWRLSARYEKTFGELRNADLGAYQNPQVFESHKKTVISWLGEMKADNKKVVVIIFPFVHLLPNYPAVEIHQELWGIFRENGADGTVDLLDYLKGKNAKDLVASKFDNHPNEYVHKLAAEKLFETVAPLLEKTN
ncbi:MAG: SGNH/GDSL hydrolase family protein [Candidatus Curtissbacteria bacterium]|nr:SGNH/GDSL hydrolase family protein [Candidatus Curtissbacteria bacterium]